tara:strand:+ start:3683 stop:4093 length:411 start_codon:yes stop_codon:yes gene_type:complete
MPMNAQQKKEARAKAYLKYCNSDKGKQARRKALQKYYAKNKQKIIEKNMKYYTETYSKVIGTKRGTGKKKGKNHKIIGGDKVTKIKDKVFTVNKVEDDKTYLIKDATSNKHYKLTTAELTEMKVKNKDLAIVLNFD